MNGNCPQGAHQWFVMQAYTDLDLTANYRLFDGVIPQNLHLTSIIAGHCGLMTNQIMLISKESSVTYLLGKDFNLIISNPRSLHLLHVLWYLAEQVRECIMLFLA